MVSDALDNLYSPFTVMVRPRPSKSVILLPTVKGARPGRREDQLMERTVIVRWTGRGKKTDFRSAILSRIGGAPVGTKVVGNSILVDSRHSLETLTSLHHLPGTAWLAAGYEVRTFEDIGKTAGELAKNYLRKGGRFSVEAEGTERAIVADAAGTATSGIIDRVRGARVSIDAPGVKFRVAFDGTQGAVGVQLQEGPGGVATGSVRAICLVSGGPHSSVVSWMAALAGFRIRLVHAMSTDSAMLGTARLYSELSHRMDPRQLSLTVLRGGAVVQVLRKHIANSGEVVFGGFRAGRNVPLVLGDAVSSPLSLLPEERFSAEFASLGIKGDEAVADWEYSSGKKYSASDFGGVTADVSDVLDGLA